LERDFEGEMQNKEIRKYENWKWKILNGLMDKSEMKNWKWKIDGK
jgi:hypothetical protein